MAWHTFVFGGRTVPYELEVKRVRTLRAHVRHDGTLSVSVPPRCGEATLSSFLETAVPRLLPAIEKQRAAYLRETAPPPVSDGTEIPLFGKTAVLHRLVAEGRHTAFSENEILLFCPAGDGEDAVRRQLHGALKNEAKRTIEEICRKIYAEWFSSEPMPTVRFRRMRSMWGNCRPTTRTLTFNPRLVYADRGAIAYVVLHEFTHLRYADHSSRFWAAVVAHMPDYARHKEALRQIDLSRNTWL